MRMVISLACLALFSAGASAAGYSEKKSGDLSDDGLAPTAVKLKLGDNRISGDYGAANGVVDRDYFTFKIAEGQQLAALWVEPGTTVGLSVSFIGVQKGKQVTVPPTGGSAKGLLGWTLYGEGDIGTDILPAIGQGADAKGFEPPLGPGTYSFWVQETGTCECSYKFRFVVTAPASKSATQETAGEPPGTDSRPIKTPPPPYQPEDR